MSSLAGPAAADLAAQWMADQVESDGSLYQDVAASYIGTNFGADLVTTNAAGNVAIASSVLKAFNKLTPELVWERGTRSWRRRADYDLPGRMQP